MNLRYYIQCGIKIFFQQYANIAHLLRRRNYFFAISFICPGDLTNASKIPVRSYQSRRLLIFLYLPIHEDDWTSSLPIAFLITVCLLSFHGDRARRFDRQDRIGCRERFKSSRRQIHETKEIDPSQHRIAVVKNR